MQFTDSDNNSMSKNTQLVLCYLFWWLGGIGLLILSKDKKVRVHAAQSVIFFGLITFFMLLPIIGKLFFPVLFLGGFTTWLYLLFSVSQGRDPQLPYVSKWGRRMLGDVSVSH
jgi:uncharacterized membrane protein